MTRTIHDKLLDHPIPVDRATAVQTRTGGARAREQHEKLLLEQSDVFDRAITEARLANADQRGEKAVNRDAHMKGLQKRRAKDARTAGHIRAIELVVKRGA